MFDQIRQGLFDRLPPHIAQGFLMNFQDESGLNPGINEISPIVPGSRGGYGLAQWTGPRRVALEGYAKSVGKPVDDVGVQLDFLMQELQGPERAAWEKISQTKTPGEAATAIVQNFLRPAKQHMQRRSQKYMTGGAGSDRLAGGLSILPNRPDRLEDNAMQPEKSGGLLGGLWDKTGLDEERRAMLAMALSGMSMRPNTGLQAAAQMKMKNASDRKTRNKTIDWLQSRGVTIWPALLRLGRLTGVRRLSWRWHRLRTSARR